MRHTGAHFRARALGMALCLALIPAPGAEGPMMEYPRGINAALAPVNAIAAGSANLLPTIVVLDRRALPDADGEVRRDRFVRLDGMCWSWESDCGLWRGADGWWSSELGRDAPPAQRAGASRAALSAPEARSAATPDPNSASSQRSVP